LFGEEKALSLRQLDGRNAELAAYRAAELPRAGAKVLGQTLKAPAIVERTGFDAASGRPCHARNRVHRSVARSQLRSTAQARPEPLLLGQGRVREKPAPTGQRRPRGTDGPAIDPRSRNADIEQAVETGITRHQGPIASLIIDFHDLILAVVDPRFWPFSDFETNLSGRGATYQTTWSVCPAPLTDLVLGSGTEAAN
jgi:hypothetical protein